jgi:hypothetical protein
MALEADKAVKTAMRKRLHGIGEGGAQTDQEALGHSLAEGAPNSWRCSMLEESASLP